MKRVGPSHRQRVVERLEVLKTEIREMEEGMAGEDDQEAELAASFAKKLSLNSKEGSIVIPIKSRETKSIVQEPRKSVPAVVQGIQREAEAEAGAPVDDPMYKIVEERLQKYLRGG